MILAASYSSRCSWSESVSKAKSFSIFPLAEALRNSAQLAAVGGGGSRSKGSSASGEGRALMPVWPAEEAVKALEKKRGGVRVRLVRWACNSREAAGPSWNRIPALRQAGQLVNVLQVAGQPGHGLVQAQVPCSLPEGHLSGAEVLLLDTLWSRLDDLLGEGKHVHLLREGKSVWALQHQGPPEEPQGRCQEAWEQGQCVGRGGLKPPGSSERGWRVQAEPLSFGGDPHALLVAGRLLPPPFPALALTCRTSGAGRYSSFSVFSP